MTGEELGDLMISEGIDTQFSVADGNYSLPSTDWFYGTFYRAFWDYLKAMGISKYEVDANDCDKFSDQLRSFAQMLEARDKQRVGRALAVGVLAYLQDGGGGHAIAFAVCRVKVKPRLCFIEPQNGLEVKLSEDERLQCLWWRI